MNIARVTQQGRKTPVEEENKNRLWLLREELVGEKLNYL
jgi:hypothetical protein